MRTGLGRAGQILPGQAGRRQTEPPRLCLELSCSRRDRTGRKGLELAFPPVLGKPHAEHSKSNSRKARNTTHARPGVSGGGTVQTGSGRSGRQ